MSRLRGLKGDSHIGPDHKEPERQHPNVPE